MTHRPDGIISHKEERRGHVVVVVGCCRAGLAYSGRIMVAFSKNTNS
jgi:hypothetical protein